MSQEQPSWKKNIHDEEFKREAPQPALWKKNCDPDHESFGFTQAYGEEVSDDDRLASFSDFPLHAHLRVSTSIWCLSVV
eukprot:1123928-Rhodomonas_salina.2